MRKSLVAGNWKMNGSIAEAKSLIDGVLSGIGDVTADVAVCPPYIYVPLVGEMLQGSAIGLGAQNVSKEEAGAFTGEISGAMLTDVGCRYAIIGHSERRSLYGESDELVAEKYAACLRHGLTPILCVGESLDERENGATTDVVERQLKAVVDVNGIEAIAKGVIAYEPVWAIGTGMTATPQQAQDVHAFIRGWLGVQDAEVAQKVQILYGGSVKGSNAAELFAQADIDGGLIGGASLLVDDFLTICRAAK